MNYVRNGEGHLCWPDGVPIDPGEVEDIVYSLRVETTSCPDTLADAWEEFATELERIAAELRKGYSNGVGWFVYTNHPELVGR